MAIKKPSGKSGIVRAQSDGQGNYSIEFIKTSFPQDKDELETSIMNRFIYSSNKISKNNQPVIFSATKNKLDDFDFTVLTSTGEVYFELMEIAPLEQVRGGYSEAPNTYNVYSRVENIYKKIIKKSQRYPSKNDKPLCLLIYATHFAFDLGHDNEINLLRYFCALKQLNFSGIYVYSILDDTEGVVEKVYPVSPDFLKNFDPLKCRHDHVIKFDPSNFEIVSS